MSDAGDLAGMLNLLARTLQAQQGPVVDALPHGGRGYHVLTAVVHCEQPSHQAALAAHLGIDRTVMTYLLDDLEDAGLVERRPNPSDRRQRQVVPTAAGIAAVGDLCQRVRAAEDAALSGLEPGERDTLRALLARATGGTSIPS